MSNLVFVLLAKLEEVHFLSLDCEEFPPCTTHTHQTSDVADEMNLKYSATYTNQTSGVADEMNLNIAQYILIKHQM